MRVFKTSALAVSALALASIATPSLAGSPYYDAMGNPMTADQADMVHDEMTNPGMMAAHPHSMGRFTCSPTEKRTKLERQACGATKMMN